VLLLLPVAADPDRAARVPPPPREAGWLGRPVQRVPGVQLTRQVFDRAGGSVRAGAAVGACVGAGLGAALGVVIYRGDAWSNFTREVVPAAAASAFYHALIGAAAGRAAADGARPRRAAAQGAARGATLAASFAGALVVLTVLFRLALPVPPV